jgi:hypothetical protein
MRRTVALLVSATLVVLVGCGRSYNDRVEATLTRMRYQQRLDQNLAPAQTGSFQELGVYFRPPKALSPAQQPGLSVGEGLFDIQQTFLDLSGGEQVKDQPPARPLRLHVLGRVNRKKPAAKKKDAAPEPQPAVPRGEFVADVRSVLASDLSSQEALDNPVQTDKKRSNEFKRLIFNASNGDAVRVYFYKQAEYDLAFIWDIPPGQEKSPAMTTGAELAMESMAVGPRAVNAFQSGTVEDDLIEAAPAGGEGAAAGQAF